MRVAILTVGDELLVGDTVNTNAAWLGERLTARGADVERATTVPDRVDDIAEVVDAYADRYDALVVTGGLGPTHDDVTMAGVAAAFDRELRTDEQALAWLTDEGDYSRDDLVTGTADLPAGSEPLHNEVGVAPGCVLGNVYVLPGVPAEMKAMFESVAARFTGTVRHVERVAVDEPESALIERFDELRERFGVKVGSYPGEVVSVKLESEDPDAVAAAASWLREHAETTVSS
ncbi:competence/damage-inducible protein A [Halosegnis sp.]|uniref:competence/damage-inducible protein A n=1 Tax=Halosegnis sp. TaxID=2864959 RepID=UPI0035D47617